MGSLVDLYTRDCLLSLHVHRLKRVPHGSERGTLDAPTKQLDQIKRGFVRPMDLSANLLMIPNVHRIKSTLQRKRSFQCSQS